MNLILDAIWLFINLGCVFRDILLMNVLKGKNNCDIRMWGWLEEQSDEFLWTRLFGSIAKLKNSPCFLFFAFIFNNKKEKQKMEGSFYFYEKNSPRFLFFAIFLLLTTKRRWSAVQNSLTSFPLI